MRVGVVIDNEFVNDIRVRTEVDILVNGGHDVYVLHLNFSNNSLPTIEGLRQQEIFIERRKKDFQYATMNWNSAYENMWSREVARFINSNDLELIHTHDLYMSKACKTGIKNSTNPSAKLILDLHENFPYAIQLYNWATKFPRNLIVQPKKWLSKELEYLSYADKIITLSDFFANELCTKHNLEKESFFAFPNVPDIKRFESFGVDKDILPKDKGVVRLFYFGAIAERRGIFLVLEAFSELSKKYNVELLIIGPVDKKDKERFDLEIENNSKIIFVPWIDISDLGSYIINCDICLSPLDKNPQHESGVANKVYQYMYFKKALLVSDCGPQAELVEHSKCGLVHVYNDKEDFISKVEELINNPISRIEMGNSAQEEILNKYNSDSYSSKLLEMYSGLI